MLRTRRSRCMPPWTMPKSAWSLRVCEAKQRSAHMLESSTERATFARVAG